MSIRFLRSSIALLTLSALALAGCSGSTTPEETGAAYDPEADVTITVGGMPTSDQVEQLEAFNAKVEAFEGLYPHITVEGSEVVWDAQTFAAQLAGGTLPTTLPVAYTDIGNLISNGQVAEITEYLDDDQSLAIANLNESLLSIAKDGEGRVFGVPNDVYSMVIFYNRALYEEAGLDPDTPPATWEEVRENAQTITEATGTAGFAIPAIDNFGGWLLTAMSYSMGDTLENADGDAVTANVNNEATAQALQLLYEMQWTDHSYATNVLTGYVDVATDLAAGEVGQWIGMGSAQAFNLAVRNGLSYEDIGLGVLPQGENGLGTLAGGAVQIVNPEATPNQIAAALKWINYDKYLLFYDQDAAVANAKAINESGEIVGAPVTPLVDDETYEQYLEWIDEYINVDRGKFAAFLEQRDSVPVIPEPQVAAQEIYATLDSVIQSVLTDQNADIGALLETAQSQAEALVASAQR